VVRLVNDAHAAFADLLDEFVLAELPGFEFGFGQAAAPDDLPIGEHQHDRAREDEQQEQD
jgi:hypothetical protein